MAKINLLRFTVFLLYIVFAQGCVHKDQNSAVNLESTLDLIEDLDSSKIDSLYHVVGKTDYTSDYKHIDQILSNSPNAKDTLVLAKAYSLIALKNILSKDYEKAINYLEQSVTLFKKLNMWVEVMRENKNLATIYRNQNKFYLMTTLLKNDIRLMDSVDAKSFGVLYPIHELTVHYSYDLNKHKEAIVQGELFFEKLAHFDSMPINNPHFNYIKKSEKDVIDLVLGVSYLKLGHYEKSYKHLNLALVAYSELKDAEKLNRIHKAFIEYYIQAGNKEKLIYHKEAFFKTALQRIDKITIDAKEINDYKLKSIADERDIDALAQKNKLKSLLIYVSVVALVLFTLFQWYFSKLRREKQEVALQLEKQSEFNTFKTNLLITIAHELRTPLTIILGNLQLISDKKIKPNEFKSYIDKIRNNSQDILDKMSNIIKLMKDGKSKASVEIMEVSILPFLKGLFFGFEGMAQTKRIQLIFNAQLPNNYILKTDPKLLNGLVSNLILNAIKFSHSNSVVKMHVNYYQDSLRIKIIDQGIGISSADQEVIFEKFNRIPTGSVVDGFGIGLAIVKDLTVQLGGEINVQSSIGEGSTFTLHLPNETQVINFEAQSKVMHRYASDNDKKTTIEPKGLGKILIVEDNPQMCNFYEHIFSDILDCTFAFNGLEGLKMVKDNTFDLILSDVMMPKMNGFQLKENVRMISNLEHIPFILVTAKDQDESKIKAFNIGVDDYITKPFNKNELIARIKSLITNKQAREKWVSINDEEITLESNSIDVKTVQKMHELVLEHCDDINFGVPNLAKEIGLSQRQLIRVIKKLTGLTPVKFILEVRLLEAYKKISNKEVADINKVRFSVGIQSASYFSTQFKKRFGLNPTDLGKTKKTELINLENNISNF